MIWLLRNKRVGPDSVLKNHYAKTDADRHVVKCFWQLRRLYKHEVCWSRELWSSRRLPRPWICSYTAQTMHHDTYSSIWTVYPHHEKQSWDQLLAEINVTNAETSITVAGLRSFQLFINVLHWQQTFGMKCALQAYWYYFCFISIVRGVWVLRAKPRLK